MSVLQAVRTPDVQYRLEATDEARVQANHGYRGDALRNSRHGSISYRDGSPSGASTGRILLMSGTLPDRVTTEPKTVEKT
jgi:hypothetical protein